MLDSVTVMGHEERNTMKIKNEKESNLELLRIFAMLMIILHHLVVHGFYQHLSNSAHLQFFCNWTFCWPTFSKKLLIPETIAPLGKTANNIFMLISGYFLLERGERAKLYGIAKKLLLQLTFACVVLIIVSFLLCRAYPTDITFGIPVGVKAFNQGWWFIGYYFLIITLGALFLNKKMCQCSEQTYLTVIIVLFALFSFSWSGELLNDFDELRAVSAGIFCYLSGGYCKRFNPLKNVRMATFLLLIIFLCVIMWLSYYNAVHERIIYYLHVDQGGTFIQPAGTSAYPDYGIVPISLSIIIFELFRRIKIRPNAVINYISSASFMVYLVHDNEFIRNYWAFKEDLAALLYKSPVQFCIKIGIRALLTYAVGVAAFSIYRGLMRLAKRYTHIFIKADIQSTTSL